MGGEEEVGHVFVFLLKQISWAKDRIEWWETADNTYKHTCDKRY